MGRPSNSSARTEQILDAFQTCVARYGLEGATLEKTAKEAGLARALIRHHVGNRDQLLDMLIERVMDVSRERTQELIRALPATNRVRALVGYLFEPDHDDSNKTRLMETLITASYDRPELAGELKTWSDEFTRALTEEVQAEFPNQSSTKCEIVATGIAALYANAESMAALGGREKLFETSQQAALLLLESMSSE